MRKGSRKEFGLVEIDVDDLKVVYEEPLENIIDVTFADEGKYADIPIIIDKNNNIIDGHHRFWFIKGRGDKKTHAVRLNIVFSQSKHWRDADNHIKAFSVMIGRNELYEGFKGLAKCLC